MKLSCYICGYRSDAAAFFRIEPCGLFGGRRPVCAVCPAHARSADERRKVRQAPTAVAMWVLFFPFILAISDVDHARLYFIFFAATILGLPLATAVHECGHIVFGWAAGLTVNAVFFGEGRRRYGFRVGTMSVALSRYPFVGGRTYVVGLHEAARWRTAICLLGGAVGNLAATVVFMTLAQAVSNDAPSISVFLAGAAISQGLSGAGALVPRTDRRSGLRSDGKQLLGLLRAPAQVEPWSAPVFAALRMMSADRYAEAEQLFRVIPEETLSKRSDIRVFALSMRLHCLSRAKGDRAAFADYLDDQEAFNRAEALNDEEARPHLPLLQANIAWLIVKAGHDAISLAERLARAAAASQPDANWSKGTLGAVLVAKGEASDGASLLCEAVRQTEDQVDRSDFCRFLARAERILANEAGATEFERAGQYALRAVPLPE